MNLVFAPFYEYDKELHARYEDEKLYFDTVQLPRWKELPEDERGSKPKAPVHHEVVMQNYTQEALDDSLLRNPAGLIVINDEAAGAEKRKGQYKGGRGDETETELSDHNAQPRKVSRKTGPSFRLERPTYTRVGNTQPKVYSKLFAGLEDCGGLDRKIVMLALDVRVPTWRGDSKGMPEALTRRWRDAIRAILNVPYYGKPTEVPLSPGALDLLNAWHNEGAERCNRSSAQRINKLDTDAFTAIFAKMVSYCLRFSLVVEVARNVCGDRPDAAGIRNVSAESMASAIRLSDYFINQALEVRRMGGYSRLEALHPSRRRLYDALPSTPFPKAEGWKLAQELDPDLSLRSFERFLGTRAYFASPSRGIYQKQANNQYE